MGLQRRGFSPERVSKIQRAFRVLLASKLNTSQAIERLCSDGDLGEDVEVLIQFIQRLRARSAEIASKFSPTTHSLPELSRRVWCLTPAPQCASLSL